MKQEGDQVGVIPKQGLLSRLLVLLAHGGYATLKMPEKFSALPVLSVLGSFGLQWGFRKTDWWKLVSCVVALCCVCCDNCAGTFQSPCVSLEDCGDWGELDDTLT